MGKGKVKPPTFNWLFLHIYNALQQLKITEAIEFITNLFKESENEDPTATIVILFGCTGKGNGAWVSVLRYTFLLNSFNV